MNNNEYRDRVERLVAAIYDWDRPESAIVSRAVRIIEEIDKLAKKAEERMK